MQLAIEFAGENWKVDVLVELGAWCAVHWAQGNTDMTMEQFRAQAVHQPASHKAWGSLPGVACMAGLIAPMSHPDGSPVMRFAESVKTHRHPVRVWRLLPPQFSAAETTGTRAASQHDGRPAVREHQPMEVARVGDGRLSCAPGGVSA